MPALPCFPEFNPIALEDRGAIRNVLREYQPQTSELTFTNLFIWREHYGVRWSMLEGCLIVVCCTMVRHPFSLPSPSLYRPQGGQGKQTGHEPTAEDSGDRECPELGFDGRESPDVGTDWFILPPVGPPMRGEVVTEVLTWLQGEKHVSEPRIDRADKRLVGEINANSDLAVEPVRDHFDYVYRSDKLISLAGWKPSH